MKHLLIVISGPSGVGKGTIVDELMKRGNYALSVSCTTRGPRDGESEGVSYFYISEQQFLGLIESNGLLEYSRHFGNYYGTPRDFVARQLESKDVILEIEVNGALQVKKAYPDALLIFIAPPSREELISRLRRRGAENEEKIAERVGRMDTELSHKDEYDFVIVNDKLEFAVEQIENIIEGARRAL